MWRLEGNLEGNKYYRHIHELCTDMNNSKHNKPDISSFHLTRDCEHPTIEIMLYSGLAAGLAQKTFLN